jgi:hypothetical protein
MMTWGNQQSKRGAYAKRKRNHAKGERREKVGESPKRRIPFLFIAKEGETTHNLPAYSFPPFLAPICQAEIPIATIRNATFQTNVSVN